MDPMSIQNRTPPVPFPPATSKRMCFSNTLCLACEPPPTTNNRQPAGRVRGPEQEGEERDRAVLEVGGAGQAFAPEGLSAQLPHGGHSPQGQRRGHNIS